MNMRVFGEWVFIAIASGMLIGAGLNMAARVFPKPTQRVLICVVSDINGLEECGTRDELFNSYSEDSIET